VATKADLASDCGKPKGSQEARCRHLASHSAVAKSLRAAILTFVIFGIFFVEAQLWETSRTVFPGVIPVGKIKGETHVFVTCLQPSTNSRSIEIHEQLLCIVELLGLCIALRLCPAV